MPTRVVYVFDDVALASKGATIIGTPSADANFPASNVLNPDRKVRYRTAANPGSQVDLDVDLGAGYDAAQVIGGVGVHYMLTEQAAPAGPDVTVYSSGSGFGSMTQRATVTGSSYWAYVDPLGVRVRDWLDTFTGVTAQRYWRFRFAPSSTRFSVGKVLVGTAADFGFLYSPGSDFSWEPAGDEVRTMDRDPVDVVMGEARKHYAYTYDEITDTERAVLEKIARQARPFGLIDTLGTSNHVRIPRRQRTAFSHVFSDSPGLWSAKLELEQLP
jgi:hypothetical protein